VKATLEKAIAGFGSATLDARSAQRDFCEVDRRRPGRGEERRATAKDATQAGRDKQAALDDVAQSTLDAAAKTLQPTHNTEDAEKQMKTGRAAFIKAAEAAGYNADEAKRLADKLGLIPKNVRPRSRTSRIC
jgi:methylphosphotriester-DNA--protein-cysteine methyltransferase